MRTLLTLLTLLTFTVLSANLSCDSDKGESAPFLESIDLPMTILAEGYDDGDPYTLVGLASSFEDVELRLSDVFEEHGWVVTRCCQGDGVFWAQSQEGDECVSYNDLAREKQRLALAHIVEADHPQVLLEIDSYQAAVLATFFQCV